MSNAILSKIDEFLSVSGMSAYRFGYLSVKNGRLVDRLREGGRVWPEQQERILSFIEKQRPTFVVAANGSDHSEIHPSETSGGAA